MHHCLFRWCLLPLLLFLQKDHNKMLDVMVWSFNQFNINNFKLPCQVSNEFWIFCASSQFLILGTKSWATSSMTSPKSKFQYCFIYQEWTMYELQKHHPVIMAAINVCSTFGLNYWNDSLNSLKLVCFRTSELRLGDSFNPYHMLSSVLNRFGLKW